MKPHTYRHSLPCISKTTLASRNKSIFIIDQRKFSSRITPAASLNSNVPGDLNVDICIVGAGIIGLSAAAILLESDPSLSIALLDSKLPSAATGAGQGYVWMAHREANSTAWEIAARSKALWLARLSQSTAHSPINTETIEWQSTGSMLIANTPEEVSGLKERENNLRSAGVEASFVDASEAMQIEPALSIKESGGGLLVPGDSQINGRLTATAFLETCTRSKSLFNLSSNNEGCSSLLYTSSSSRDCIQGIETTLGRRIITQRGVIMANGAWCGEFLAKELIDQPQWKDVLKPRKGHLLEMPRPNHMPELKRGLMEVGYTKHYTAHRSSSSVIPTSSSPSSSPSSSSGADITFTATTSASGSLLVGSSRDFLGYDSHVQPEVIDSIMSRAIDFLPGLSHVKGEDISVRIGLRPFSTVGTMIGPIDAVKGLFVATGHEGSGLTLGLATAELLTDYVLERPFSLSQKCVDAVSPRKVIGKS